MVAEFDDLRLIGAGRESQWENQMGRRGMWGRKGKQTLPAAQQDHPPDKLGDGDGDGHDVDDHDGRILATRGTLGLS